MKEIGLKYIKDMQKQKEEVIDLEDICITLEEMKRLREQEHEKKYSKYAAMFGGDGIEETEQAEEAKKILSKARVYITLKEMKELKEQSKEKRERGEGELAPILDGVDKMAETEDARKAQELLSKANVYISLEEMKELKEIAKEKKYSEYATIFGGDGMIETEQAREAKEILSKARVFITLNEMKELKEQTKERKNERSDGELMPILDVVNENGESERAREAKEILSKARVVITLKEMEELKEQAKEREYSEYAAIFGGDGMRETEQAREANDILNMENLIIGLGESKQKVLFTSAEIGRATLKQQEQTINKKEEEKSREDNIKLMNNYIERN